MTDPLDFDKADFSAKDDAASAPTDTPPQAAAPEPPAPTPEAIALAARAAASTPRRRFWRSFAFGSGAAIASSIAWYAITALTGYEIGLVAIAVGLAIGVAVRVGSYGLGGRSQAILAVSLTYVAIALSRVPAVIGGFMDAPPPVEAAPAPDAHTSASRATAAAQPAPAPAAAPTDRPVSAGEAVLGVGIVLLLAIGIALIAPIMEPFLDAGSGIMGLIILGIALYEAWRINRPAPAVPASPPDAAT